MDDIEEKLLDIVTEIFILGKISMKEPDKAMGCALLAFMKRKDIMSLLESAPSFDWTDCGECRKQAGLEIAQAKEEKNG